jgi:hypothetical protein
MRELLKLQQTPEQTLDTLQAENSQQVLTSEPLHVIGELDIHPESMSALSYIREGLHGRHRKLIAGVCAAGVAMGSANLADASTSNSLVENYKPHSLKYYEKNCPAEVSLNIGGHHDMRKNGIRLQYVIDQKDGPMGGKGHYTWHLAKNLVFCGIFGYRDNGQKPTSPTPTLLEPRAGEYDDPHFAADPKIVSQLFVFARYKK